MKNCRIAMVLVGVFVVPAGNARTLDPVRFLPVPAQSKVAGVGQDLSMTAGPANGETSEKREIAVDGAVKNLTTANAPDAKQTGAKLEGGVLVVAELTKSLNAKKVKPGEKVTAKIIQDVVVNGKVVMSRGSKLIGNVTETRARSKEDPESRLGIIFCKAMLKEGGELQLEAVIQALAPVQRVSRVNEPDLMLPPVIGPDNQSNMPQPVTQGRTVGQSGNPRGAPPSPPPAGIGQATAPRLSAGTIPVAGDQSHNPNMLSAGSRGVFGFPGLVLRYTGGAQVPVIMSHTEDVKLESGTQMVLKTTGR
jgi:hypothetical protein